MIFRDGSEYNPSSNLGINEIFRTIPEQDPGMMARGCLYTAACFFSVQKDKYLASLGCDTLKFLKKHETAIPLITSNPICNLIYYNFTPEHSISDLHLSEDHSVYLEESAQLLEQDLISPEMFKSLELNILKNYSHIPPIAIFSEKYKIILNVLHPTIVKSSIDNPLTVLGDFAYCFSKMRDMQNGRYNTDTSDKIHQRAQLMQAESIIQLSQASRNLLMNLPARQLALLQIYPDGIYSHEIHPDMVYYNGFIGFDQ